MLLALFNHKGATTMYRKVTVFAGRHYAERGSRFSVRVSRRWLQKTIVIGPWMLTWTVERGIKGSELEKWQMKSTVIYKHWIPIVMVAMTSVANAYDGDRFMVHGVGQDTCGRMVDDVLAYREARSAYIAYIDGYVTAVNFLVPGPVDLFAGSDSAARYNFVLQYCRNHPLEHVFNGIIELVRQYRPSYPK